jgi:hypothetical protein
MKRSDEKGEYFELYVGESDTFLLEWEDKLGSETIVAASSVWTAFSGTLTKEDESVSVDNKNTLVLLKAASAEAYGSEHVWRNRILTSGPPERELFGYIRIKILQPATKPAQVSPTQQLEELNQVVNTGAKEIESRPGGYRRVVYRTKEEIDQIKSELESEISGSPASNTSRCTLASHRRG